MELNSLINLFSAISSAVSAQTAQHLQLGLCDIAGDQWQPVTWLSFALPPFRNWPSCRSDTISHRKNDCILCPESTRRNRGQHSAALHAHARRRQAPLSVRFRLSMASLRGSAPLRASPFAAGRSTR
jgi:hypothetical protein